MATTNRAERFRRNPGNRSNSSVERLVGRVAVVLVAALVAGLFAIVGPGAVDEAAATVADASSPVTYKEYWVNHRKFQGSCDSEFNPGGYFYLEPSPCAKTVTFDIDDDFSGALKAEVYLNLWRNRDVPKVKFDLNGERYQPDVGADWGRTPWVGEVDLAHLVQGENEMRFTALFPIHVHDIAIRIYYNAANPLLPAADSDVTPPGGQLTSIVAANGTFDPDVGGVLNVDNDTLTFTANANDDEDVAYVDFIAYYEGYDLDADGITKEWQVTNRNNWNPGGRSVKSTGGMINHVGSDDTAPYSVTWSLPHVANQSDVLFKIRVVDTSGNVREASGGISQPFTLSRSHLVETYTIDNFDDAVLHHDGLFPDIAVRTIDLPQDLSGVTRGYILGNYWQNPRISFNGHPNFRAHTPQVQDTWTLSIKEIDLDHIGPGLNDIIYEYSGFGFGQFIEKPGPMIVLHRDIPPPAPPAITSQPGDVTISANMAATFSVVATGSPPPTYQWRRNGVPVQGATESSYTTPLLTPDDDGDVYTVAVSNSQGNVTSAPADLDIAPSGPWWNADWPYRLEVIVGAAGYERIDRPVAAGVNFTLLFDSIGEPGKFDPNSVRVIEIDGNGNVLDDNIQYQFNGVTSYDAETNADGDVVFMMEGTTAANQSRRYHIYFAKVNNDPAIGSFQQTNIINTIDNVTDGGQNSLKIETPIGTYFYQREAGAFSSLVDNSDRDWIGYDPNEEGAEGSFRGLPNAVFPEGSLHPGATDSRTNLLSAGPLRTSFRTTTLDDRFGIQWDIYPAYATATITKARANYWFLYEGTPGGALTPGSDKVVRSTGEETLVGQSFQADIPTDEWLYFTDQNLDRSLFLAHHDDDNAFEYYQPLDGAMTVFGFGRQQSDPRLRRSLEKFTIGLIDTTDFATAEDEINAAYRDLDINKGFIERQTGANVPAAPENVVLTPADGQVTVSWDEVLDNGGAVLTGHRIITTPADVPTLIVGGDVTEATVTGLDNGTSYTFRVRAENAIGLGPNSPTSDPVQPNPEPPVQSDDFNTTALDPQWEIVDPNTFDIEDEEYPFDYFPDDWVPDPEEAAEVVATGTELAIRVPGGSTHDLWTDALFAPRVLQTVPDSNFEVELAYLNDVEELFQFQGFVAQEDYLNFLRFDVVYADAPLYLDGVIKVQAARVVNGTAESLVEELIPAGNVRHLRVNRTGDNWTLEYSPDGTAWSLAGQFSHQLVVNQAGVMAGNHADDPDLSPEFVSRLDYLFNTSSPIDPEDPIPDTDPLTITNIQLAPSEDRAAISWRTDEPSTGEVDFGLTTGYGSTSAPTKVNFEHTAIITGLLPDTTYHVRIHAFDVRGEEALSTDLVLTTLPVGVAESVIEVWSGLTQNYGHQGQPQRWVNILGNVTDIDGIDYAYFTINGGEQQLLSLGDDDRRLEEEGDINVEIGYADLFRGFNSVVISIVDFYGNVVTQEIELDVDQGRTWELPYSIDWSAATSIEDVSQIVDGEWTIDGGNLRPLQIGYDRVVGIGDLAWTDYEVTVPITLHSLDPAGYEFPSAGPAVGVIMRWPGHYDWDGSQPRYGFSPLGAIGWYRFQTNDVNRLVLSDQDGLNSKADLNFEMQFDTTYMFKMAVETDTTPGAAGHRYTLTVWEQGQPEQTGVTLTDTQPLTNLTSGSFLLVAHHVDASFGDVDVQRINPDLNPLITPDSGIYNAEQLVTINTPYPGAVVRYTTDGSRPTTTSPAYTGPFTVNTDTVVKAIAIREGLDVSGVSTSEYIIEKGTAIVSDDFSGGSFDSSLWSVFDPRGDVEVSVDADQLFVDLPGGGSHDLFDSRLLAPRILQYAPDDDFEVEAKFEGDYTGTFTMQGLIVQQTFNDFLRIDVYRKDDDRFLFAAPFVNGRAAPVFNQQIATTGDVYVRLGRSVHDWTLEWSDDGANWNAAATFYHAMEVNAVGVWTGSHNNSGPTAPMTGIVDYFFNTASPITPEDGVPPSNLAPVADAGPDLVVERPAAVLLDGTLTDDGQPVAATVQWELISGPGNATIANPSAIDTSATFDAAGTHVFRLTADDTDFSDADVVEVVVSDNSGAPDVDAGSGQTVTIGQVAQLPGTVTDDGQPGPLTTLWSVDSGPGTASFGNASNRVTNVTFDTAGVYVLRLAADDTQYDSFDLIEIEVVKPRKTEGLLALYDFADADGDVVADVSANGQPLDIHIGNTNSVTWKRGALVVDTAVEIASFDEASKVVDPIAQSNELTVETWVRTAALTQSGPARMVSISADSAARNFTLGQGPDGAQTGKELDLRLRTTDTDDNGLPSMVTPNVLNEDIQHVVYTRDGGGVVTVYVDGAVVATDTLTGALSNWDPTHYLTLANEYEGGRPWLGEFQLLAIYDNALTPSEVADHFQHGPEMIGGNIAPIVDAGANVTFELPAPLELNGSVIDDRRPTRNGLLINWSVVSGPGPVDFDDIKDPAATADFSVPGTYVLELTADDGEDVADDSIIVNVLPIPPNSPPDVDAGPDLEIEVIDNAEIDASVTDDGYPWPGELTIGWTVVSGPGNAVIDDPEAEDISVVFDQVGSYVLELTAADLEETVTDQVTITVVEPPRAFTGLVALYGFAEGSGNVVRDVSGIGTPLDLTIADPGNVSWGADTLTIDAPTMITSSGPASKIINTVRASNAITVEAWLAPSETVPSEPGRIAVVGEGFDTYNVVLSQGYHSGLATNLWRTKTRTNASSANPLTVIEDTELTHVVYVRDHNVQKNKLYINGQLVDERNSFGDLSNWDDDFMLALGNELSGGKPWEGTYELLAFYSRTLSDNEVLVNYLAGTGTQGPPVIEAGDDILLEHGPAIQLDATATDDGFPDPPGTMTLQWTVDSGPGTATFSNAAIADPTVTFDTPGTYVLRLEGYDGSLASSDTVTVSSLVNSRPVVNAGADQLIEYPANATLDGTVTDDGLPLVPGSVTTTWTQVSGPGTATFVDPQAVDTVVSFSTDGVYVLRLTANDGSLLRSDTIEINAAANQRPVVSAGPDRTVVAGIPIAIDGSITDDGLPLDPGLTTAQWTQVSGPATVGFSDPQAEDTDATFPGPGIYVLRLTGNDGELQKSDTVSVDVSPPDRISTNLLALYGFEEGSGTLVRDISGVGTPLDLTVQGPSNTSWIAGGLRLDDPTQLGSGQPAAKIIDGAKATGEITLEAWVTPSSLNPSGPGRIATISADGNSRNILLGQGFFAGQPADVYRGAVRTTGTAGTTVGSLDTTTLTHIAYTIDTATGLSKMYVNGELDFTRVISGGFAGWNSAYPLTLGQEPPGGFSWLGEYHLVAFYDQALTPNQVLVNFQAGSGTQQPPTVDAGENQSVSLGSAASLDGTVIDDGLPDPPAAVSTTWSEVSGPGTVTFADPNAVDTTATFSAGGVYVLQLAADDGAVESTDSVTVTVVTNQAPVVDAGPDESVQFPQAAAIDATVTDDGLPDPPGTVTYQWSKVSGPGAVTFGNPTAADTTASFSVAGVYVLQLEADDSLLQSTDTVTVTSGDNQAPTADAGPDFSAVTDQEASLAGSMSDDGLPDPPGAPAASWTVVSGPGAVTFGDAAAASTTVTFDTAGAYILRLTADDSDLTDSDTVTIVVDDPSGPSGAIAVYEFSEGSGSVVRDTSGVGTALDLTIDTPGNTSWLSDGLSVDAATKISSSGPADKITTAAISSGEITIEAWIAPNETTPADPGSVAAISANFGTRNILLSQGSTPAGATDLWRGYVRTSGTPQNPFAVVGSTALQHVVYTVDTTSGTIKLYVDGVEAMSRTTTGNFGNWNANYALTLANEPPGDRGWLGEFHRLVFYDRALAPSEVGDSYTAGPGGNNPPSVDVGDDISVNHPAPATLNATVSDDGQPDPPGVVSLTWSQLGGPGTATFANPNAEDTTVTFDTPGTYELQLLADDGESFRTDSLLVTSDHNDPPNVEAGPPMNGSVGVPAPLDGTVTDDGIPDPPGAPAVTWTEQSGPGNVTFDNAGAVDTNAWFDAPGTYVLELTADDGLAQASDTVTVTVDPTSRVTQNLIAFYEFDEGSGNTVNDTSGFGTALDLTITNPGNVTWGADALSIDLGTSGTILTSGGPATKLIDEIKGSNALTLEAWITPAFAEPRGPGRIMGITQTQASKNVAVSQGYFSAFATDIWETRLRTSANANNRWTSGSTQPEAALTHLVYTRASNGRVKIFLNGVQLTTRMTQGDLSAWDETYAFTLAGDANSAAKWKGSFDLVAVYNRAISVLEVAQNYAAGPNP